MKKMNRRDFLTNASQLTALGLILPYGQFTFALNPEHPDRLFIQLFGTGGAHPPLGLNGLLLQELRSRNQDPIDTSDERVFLSGYRDGDLYKMPNGTYLGPGARRLRNVLRDVSIINGVMMIPNDVSHPGNTELMMNGRLASRSSFVSQIEKHLTTAYYGTLTSGRLGSNSKSIDENTLSGSTPNEDMIPVYRAQSEAVPLSTDLQSAQNDIVHTTEQFKTYGPLKRTYEDQLGQGNWLASAAAGFQSGLLNSAFKTFDVRVDTHRDHVREQIFGQESYFDAIADMIRFLKATPFRKTEKSLFDVTTFLFCSEFSRTSAENGRGGTEHNPLNNSCLIGGGGIRGGQVVGNSTIIPAERINNGGESALHALPYNHSDGVSLSYEDFAKYLRGEYTGTVDYIFPKDVYKTLAVAMGITTSVDAISGGRPLTKLLKV